MSLSPTLTTFLGHVQQVVLALATCPGTPSSLPGPAPLASCPRAAADSTVRPSTPAARPVVLLSQQLALRLPVPHVAGPAEFTEYCALCARVDALLEAGVERDFVTRSVAEWSRRRQRAFTQDEQQAFQRKSQQALRCTLARALLRESLRDFCCHLAESAVLQRFCRLDHLGAVTIPGHSELQRFTQWLPVAEMRALLERLVNEASAPDATSRLGLAAPVSLDTVFADSTCAATNIHYPVDWLLLRDAVRTLIQAIQVLRAAGVKSRMPEPSTFVRDMNQGCIKMAQAGKNKKTGKAQQKEILRAMKALVQTVREHADRYGALVGTHPAPTGQMIAAQRRMHAVLARLPKVVQLAHDRIIGERPVENAEKVLSLYEPATAVITRGKAGAQVEFGYSLFVVEQRHGLIVDWALPAHPQADVDLLQEAVPRWEAAYGKGTITTAVTDRGCDGPASRATLAKAGIGNSLCPRNRQQLEQRLAEDVAFRAQLRRRAQTEGRIAILKQTFLGGALHTKGHAHQEQEVAWVILAHNLWVLARLPMASTLARTACNNKTKR